MRTQHYICCPRCGADQCDCQQIQLQAEKIRDTDLPTRAVLEAVKKAFADPAFAADYRRWKAERDALKEMMT
jgi:hypothetical protein